MHCITGLRTARLIHLSRRSLLTGLGIGTVALLAATTPASWAASGVTAGLTPDPETIDVATTDGTTVAVPVLGGGLPAGTRVAVTWASALYAVEAAPVLTRGTDAFACSFDAPPSDDGTTAGVTVVLEADLPEGDYTLALGSVRALTYPDDIIDPPAATSLTLSLPDGDEQVAQESVDTGTSTDSLWGATTGVVWSPARWGAGYHLWNPVAVAITATGPSPVPAGTMIDVQVDAGAFTGLAVGPDGAAVQGSVVGEVLRASYPLPDAVGAQDVLAIPVLATLADLNGELPAYEPPLLALTNAEASSTQRLTGLEAATREDNAFDTASRARYGM